MRRHHRSKRRVAKAGVPPSLTIPFDWSKFVVKVITESLVRFSLDLVKLVHEYAREPRCVDSASYEKLMHSERKVDAEAASAPALGAATNYLGMAITASGAICVSGMYAKKGASLFTVSTDMGEGTYSDTRMSYLPGDKGCIWMNASDSHLCMHGIVYDSATESLYAANVPTHWIQCFRKFQWSHAHNTWQRSPTGVKRVGCVSASGLCCGLGHLYVCHSDKSSNMIAVYNLESLNLNRDMIITKIPGSNGDVRLMGDMLDSVALDSQEHLLATFYRQTKCESCVLVVDRLTGKCLNTFGAFDPRFPWRTVKHPTGICVDRVSKDILVCDFEQHQVLVFSADYQFRCSFGGDGILKHPCNVAIHPTGRIIVQDRWGLHQFIR
jgi:hypothetical protein